MLKKMVFCFFYLLPICIVSGE